jgi:guanylate kinase
MGKALIFSAPSGAGKTTVVKHLLEKFDCFEFSISATSRAIRNGETAGKDYFFLSSDEFRKKVSENAFIEWEEVYSGCYYGTLKEEIDRIWASGKHVLFDVDVKGGINLKKKFGESALSVFVMPPSLETLRDRLMARSTENEESLKKRLDKAAEELTFAPEFDVTIVNKDLQKTYEETEKLVSAFLAGSLE